MPDFIQAKRIRAAAPPCLPRQGGGLESELLRLAQPLFGLDPASHQTDRIVGPIIAVLLALLTIPLLRTRWAGKVIAKREPLPGVLSILSWAP